MTLKSYESSAEYFKDQMAYIDLFIKNYGKFYTEKMHTSGKSHLNKTYMTLDEIDHALDNNQFGSDYGSRDEKHKFYQAANAMKSRIDERVRLTLESDSSSQGSVFLPFEYLSSIFKLTDFERFAVLLSFAVQLDRKYEKIFGYLNDYSNLRAPTIQTTCLIYDGNTDTYLKNMTKFYPNSKLMKYFFESDEGNMASKQLKLTNTITAFLLDSDLETILLPSVVQLYIPDKSPEPLVVHSDVQLKIRQYLSNLDTGHGRKIIMNLHGPEGIGKLDQTQHFCHFYKQSGVEVSAVRLQALFDERGNAYEKILKEITQTLLIHQAIFVLKDIEVDLHRDMIHDLYDTFFSGIASFCSVSFLLSDKALPSLTRPKQKLTVLRIPVSHPDGIMRKDIYERFFTQTSSQIGFDVDSVASKFVFTPNQIRNAVTDAIELAKWQDSTIIDSGIMHAACRSQLNHTLDKQAQRIENGGSWDRLILPDTSKDVLREVCEHVRYKSLVLDSWGFSRHLSYGTGLAVLFAGPPGTGKTFSARILAKELDLELYKVDLSQMISKYIGETEKNISALFDDAAGSSAILLFDEGDALFGKRTETKDSHDRYANVETAFLLQKVEAYEGISILTTNFMQNIDPAFLRRFRFVVHFPIPDVESRLEIWKGIYPENVPLSKHIDFEFLARNFEITGGHIKNIALSSAFKAASGFKKVDMQSIMLSIQHELGKTGKTVLRSDFGEYAYMLDS